jgi:hypothetical protein
VWEDDGGWFPVLSTRLVVGGTWLLTVQNTHTRCTVGSMLA